MPTARTFVIALFALCVGAVYAQKPDREVTFADVAPILYQNCVSCHRAGQIAPMSLLTYAEAKPYAAAIGAAVASRAMPPWHADPSVGEFANDRRLSQTEIDTIVAWVAAGAPEGDPKKMPPAPVFSDAWSVGTPDAVVSMPETYTLGEDWADQYAYFRVPTNFGKDVWLQAVEFQPGDAAVVHHAVLYIEPPGRYESTPTSERPPESAMWILGDTALPSFQLMDSVSRRVKPDAPVADDGCAAPDSETVGSRNASDILCAYAPGRGADLWPEGTAKLLPAGSHIVFEMHYSKPRGQTAKDRSRAALVFAKKPVEKSVGTRSIGNVFFAIPPGAENHRVTACWTFTRGVDLLSFMPHMHSRGKSMEYEAIYPDGRRERLLSVPRYSFHWQTLYTLARPKAIPSGTRIAVTAHFDNSAHNHHNPDPTKLVRYGSASVDEMMIGFVNYAVPIARADGTRPSDALLDEVVGRYVHESGVALTIVRDGARIFAEGDGQRIELHATGAATFTSKLTGAQLVFERDASGRITGFTVTLDDNLVRFRRAPFQ
jgi:hypothetical protein